MMRQILLILGLISWGSGRSLPTASPLELRPESAHRRLSGPSPRSPIDTPAREPTGKVACGRPARPSVFVEIRCALSTRR